MDYKVLLLTLLTATVVAVSGQTTQTSTLSEQDPTKVSSEDSSTEASSSSAEEDSVEEDGDLKSSGTAARYTFTQADARTSLSPAPTNELVTDTEEDEEEDDEAVETMADLEKILEGKNNDDDDKKDDVKTIALTSNDDDDDDDDDDEGDDDDDDEDSAKPASESITEAKSSQLRRLGELRPGIMTDGSDLDSEGKTPEVPPTPVFVPNPEAVDSSVDTSPQFHLTQGGYEPDRRFYGIYNQRQRARAGSASQQSETLEAPQAQQAPVMPPYQPQSARPMFQQNPFALPGGIQSGFFNTPPAGFTDFSSASFQSPFQPTDNGPYSTYPRDQNGFSFFQAPARQNQGMFHQNLPYQQQPVLDGNSRPVQPFFHPGGFPGLPNMDIVDDAPRPNYSPYMRPQQAQFPGVNPNFYGSVPNADFPNVPVNVRQSFQPPLYRYPDNPLTLQSSDQVDKQKQDGVPQEAKDSDALAASQDKEDPATVPFGARIKPGNDDGPSEVYLRYPIQEAGYATEENLPVQNTTEKSRNSDPSPSDPTFPFFAQAGDFRPFSHPDPYRNALNALQQGYPGSVINNSNQTREVPADPFSNNSPPVQFDDRLSPPPMMFPPYQREQVFPNRQFLPMPGLDARNPFYQLPGVQNGGFVYPPPASARSAEDSKKTPSCAQGNSTVCFEDADYPRRELIYALNSDSFLFERLSSPNQVVEEIALQDQNASGDNEGDNSICKSEIKYGLPLRAKSVKESWKVIVNLERGEGNRQFIQPLRLEICKDANQPCSFTQVKTTCVQKYSLQRLLSWSSSKGIHTDVFRLPIACSCQVVDPKA